MEILALARIAARENYRKQENRGKNGDRRDFSFWRGRFIRVSNPTRR